MHSIAFNYTVHTKIDLTAAIRYPWDMIASDDIKLTHAASLLQEKQGEPLQCHLVVAGDYWKLTFTHTEKEHMKYLMKDTYKKCTYRALKVQV